MICRNGCGRDVEPAREHYATPVCFTCLPPPKPLPIALTKTPVRVRCRLAGEVVEGLAWNDGRAPGMGMLQRDGFDYAHPISTASIETVLPSSVIQQEKK